MSDEYFANISEENESNLWEKLFETVKMHADRYEILASEGQQISLRFSSYKKREIWKEDAVISFMDGLIYLCFFSAHKEDRDQLLDLLSSSLSLTFEEE